MGKNGTTISRRNMLKTGALVGAGALIGTGGLQKAIAVQRRRRNSYTLYSYGSTPPLSKWTQPFISSIPVAAKTPSNRYSGADYYEIDMIGGRLQFHSQLPVTSTKKYTTWGYKDMKSGATFGYLGPTIEAKKGRPVVVKFRNSLPEFHPLQQAIDPTVPDAEMYGVLPGGRATPHLHGGFVAPQFDGHPHSWFTNFRGGNCGRAEHGTHYDTLDHPADNEAIFYYPNSQPAAGLWYHDHAMGVTRLNAYAGLAALYFIRDTHDTGLPTNDMHLPAGAYEVPIVLQDKTFNADGSLFYPTAGVTIEHPIWMPEFFGDTPVINGQCYPTWGTIASPIQARRYRFRFVNGSQARFYNITINTDPVSTNVPMWQIGAEQGFLAAPANVSNGLLIAPGERADVIVDFTGLSGTFYMWNLENGVSTPVPYNGGGGGPDIPQLMQFVIGPIVGTDTSFPGNSVVLPPVATLVATPTAPMREFVAKETTAPTPDGTDEAPAMVRLNQRWFEDVNPLTGSLIIEDAPKVGDTEIWQYINLTVDYHPMHSHLVAFKVKDRQAFADGTGDAYAAAYLAWSRVVDAIGARNSSTKPVLADFLAAGTTGPAPNETGFKDTVQCPPGYVTRVIAKYDLPARNNNISNTRVNLPAQYVVHCHILEHEENEMMRPFAVTADGVPPTNLPAGMWKAGEQTAAIVPTEFALEQNYPNPFNPETTIQFHLPEDAHVQLKVFNNVGQEVATLANGQFVAGSHSVSFNAGNLASGVYHYRIETGHFSSVKKMLLVK